MTMQQAVDMVHAEVRWPDGKSVRTFVRRGLVWKWIREMRVGRGGGMARVWRD